MRKMLVALVVVLAALVATSVFGQAKPSTFVSKDEAIAAYRSGNFTPYQPKFFGLSGTNPVNGTTKVVAGLEEDAVVHLLTTAGWRWTVQLEGTEYRWDVPAGSAVVYARNDCGNPADEVVYPKTTPVPATPPATATAPPPTESFVHVDGRVDVVHSGKVQVDVVEYPQQPYYQPQPAYYPAPTWGWGISFGIGFDGGGCNSSGYGTNYNYNVNNVNVVGGSQPPAPVRRPPVAGTNGSRGPVAGGTGGSRGPVAGGTGGSHPPIAGGTNEYRPPMARPSAARTFTRASAEAPRTKTPRAEAPQRSQLRASQQQMASGGGKRRK